MSKGVELLLLQLLSLYYKSNKPVGPENSKENSSKAVEAMNSPNGKLRLLPAIQHWILSPTLIFSVKSKNIKVKVGFLSKSKIFALTLSHIKKSPMVGTFFW